MGSSPIDRPHHPPPLPIPVPISIAIPSHSSMTPSRPNQTPAASASSSLPTVAPSPSRFKPIDLRRTNGPGPEHFHAKGLKSFRLSLMWSIKEHHFDERRILPAWTALYEIGGRTALPIVHLSTASVAAWRLRKGDPVAVSRRLSKAQSEDRLDEIITHVMPNMRPWRGVSIHGADDNGNLSFAITHPLFFPALSRNYDEYTPLCSQRGLTATIQSNVKRREDRLEYLKGLGLPLVYPSDV